MSSEVKKSRLAWRKRSMGHVAALGPSQAFIIDTQVIMGNEVLKAVVIHGICTRFALCGVDSHLLHTRRPSTFLSAYRAQSHMHQSDRTILLEPQSVADTSHHPEPWNSRYPVSESPSRQANVNERRWFTSFRMFHHCQMRYCGLHCPSE